MNFSLDQVIQLTAVERLEAKLEPDEALLALSAEDVSWLGIDDNLIKLAAGCSLDTHPGKSNWVEKGGGLPNYICEVAKGILDGKRDSASISRAISIAVGRVKVWAATSTNAQTKAKAATAVAQWEKLKAKSHTKK